MLNLTKYEKYILIFLLFTGLLGVGLLYGKKSTDADSVNIPQIEEISIVNINTATEDELVSLKGVGPALASRIVEYRRENGNFARKADLEKVKGIGPSKLEKIIDSIRVK